MDEFTKEQQELLKKSTLVIEPAYNGEWTIETYNQDGEFQGRFNAVDANTVIAAIRSELTGVDGPPHFEVN